MPIRVRVNSELNREMIEVEGYIHDGISIWMHSDINPDFAGEPNQKNRKFDDS
jgi:hypothetical protein